MIFVCRGRLPTPCVCCIQFCARRCCETYILTFWMALRCSETRILILPDEPSPRIPWVDRAKLWRNANFEFLESLRALAWARERLCFVSALRSSQKICLADRVLALEAGGPGVDFRLRRGVLCSTLYYRVVACGAL